ncbi:MAG: pilin [Minisyncoccia bacterium]
MSYSEKTIHVGATITFLFLMSGLFFFNASSVFAGTCAGGVYDSFGTCVCPSGTSLGGGDCVSTGGGNEGTGAGNNGTGGGNVSPIGSGKITNPLKSQDIPEFLLKIIDVLLVFALPLIILYIMYAGYLFVTAAGNAEKVTGAKNALLWSIVGGVIVLGARLIISVIQGTITAF